MLQGFGDFYKDTLELRNFFCSLQKKIEDDCAIVMNELALIPCHRSCPYHHSLLWLPPLYVRADKKEFFTHWHTFQYIPCLYS